MSTLGRLKFGWFAEGAWGGRFEYTADSLSAMRSLKILLTNDDGVDSEGLNSLSREMEALGKVTVVAPYEERSAVSHGLTIHQPLRLIERSRNRYALTGTPVDCILFAVRKLFKRPPDLVISGINHGANLGDDVHYSGTVAGAREAALYGIPAIAFSQILGDSEPDFEQAAKTARHLISEFFPDRIPRGTFLNINFPVGHAPHYRVARQGTKLITSSIEEKHDPRGRRYYWIGKDESEWLIESDTDYQAIREGFISVTPLQRDQTDYRTLRSYEKDADSP